MANDDRQDDSLDKPAPQEPRRLYGIAVSPEAARAGRMQGRAVKAARREERLEELTNRYLAAYEEFAHYTESTRMMRKRLNVSDHMLRLLERRTGKRLRDARLAAQEQAESTGKPYEREPVRGTWLNWGVLRLFDTLMTYFRAGVGEGDEPEEQDGVDHRTTWTAWRVFLAAAFAETQNRIDIDNSADGSSDAASDVARMPSYPGLPLTANVPRGAASLHEAMTPLDIFTACTGRLTWPTVQARIVSLVVGRRGGKSYITAIIGIYLALCKKYTLNLGTRGMVMILARDKEQAGVIRSYILAFLNTDPLRGFIKGDPTQKLIELTNGITIEIRSVSEAGTRGYTVVAALMDEIAFWPTDANSAKQDKKILRALRPAMFGIKNAMIVMLSSPYAQRGELYETWKKYYGKDEDQRYLVWQADTLSMRPENDAELLDEIRAEYDEDPENAKAEYGALFRTDVESLFKKSIVEGVCIEGRGERPRQANFKTYRAFVDPSGGSSDSMTLAIAHDELRVVGGSRHVIPVLDFVKEWPAPFKPEEVTAEAAEIVKRYGISQVTGDAYGGEWPREAFRKNGVGYTLSEMTRSELYLEFLPKVNSGLCELLDASAHKKMVNQLSNLERRTGRTGRDSVDHPAGSHDDVANAVAGAMTGKPSRWQTLSGCAW